MHDGSAENFRTRTNLSCATSSSAAPTGTDTPDASSHGAFGDRLLVGRMEPLRGRDADGRMVREPRRGPP